MHDSIPHNTKQTPRARRSTPTTVCRATISSNRTARILTMGDQPHIEPPSVQLNYNSFTFVYKHFTLNCLVVFCQLCGCSCIHLRVIIVLKCIFLYVISPKFLAVKRSFEPHSFSLCLFFYTKYDIVSREKFPPRNYIVLCIENRNREKMVLKMDLSQL